MFSFFKSSNKPKQTDLVYLNRQALTKAVQQFISEHPNAIIVTWFEEDEDLAARTGCRNIWPASLITAAHLHNQPLIFWGHYPLPEKEQHLVKALQLKEAVFYSSLDEPLFRQFGSERIIRLMKAMGMNEDEAISHRLVSSSIENAGKKIASRVNVEFKARSQEEWFRKNLPEDQFNP